MAACLSPRPDNDSDDAAPKMHMGIGDAKPRVVSVSPREAVNPVPVTVHAPPLDPSESVCDPQTVGQSIAADIARMDIQLASLLDAAERQQEQTTSCSMHLQERLRLGAEMLRAFQAQIERVEAVLEIQRREDADLQEMTRRLASATAECDRAREQLTNETARIESVLGALAMKADSIHDALQRTSRRSAKTDQTSITQMSELTKRAVAAASTLERLLDQFAPWERLMQRTGGSDLPGSLEQLAADVLSRVSSDLTWLTTTMRDVAQRVEQLSALSPASGSSSASRPGPQDGRDGLAGDAGSTDLPSVAPALKFTRWVAAGPA